MSGPAYAAVVEIVVEPGSDPAHRHGVLSELVIPELRDLTGYLKSLWLNDHRGTATCVVVFDDVAHARAGLEVLSRSGGPPTVRSGIHVVEVEDPPARSH
jgi:hypothetical protein